MNVRKRSFWWTFALAGGSVLCAMLVIGAFTGQWPWRMDNSYRSYSLQACAWLKGQLDLGHDYPWLELAIRDGRYYVSFPPFPSMLLLPFAAIFGEYTPDGWIALAAALAGVWHACALCQAEGMGRRGTLFWVLALFLCNGWLFISLNGWVWFFAQNLCFTLSLMALYHARRGRGVVSLACWACAVGCRPMAGLYLPLLLWLLYRHERQLDRESRPLRLVSRRWYWIIAPALIGGIYMWLNWQRFGNVLEFGHNYLPEFTRQPEGQFELSYLPQNLRALLRLPGLNQTGGWNAALSWPSINGIAFYLVNPWLLVSLAAWLWAVIERRGGKPLALLLPLLTLVYVLIVCLHRTLGGWHFGNRYLLDVMPWLLLGILRWLPADHRREQFAMAVLPYFLLGGLINVVGTIATYNGWI